MHRGSCIRPVQLLLLILALGLAGCRAAVPPAATPVRVHHYENPAALNIVYPVGWEYVVVTEGILVFGEPGTLNLDSPGASLTVYRQSPFSAAPSLQEGLQRYLRYGPLRSGYDLTSEIVASRLGGLDALEVFVATADEAANDAPAMRGLIIAAQANSGAFYVLTATAPQPEWDEQWPLFAAMVASVEFNE